MENNQIMTENSIDLLEQHAEEIDAACKLAVREALRKHKLAGNPVAVSENGRIVLLKPEEIEIG